jgi:non-homologous end joining protein Ku
MGARKQVALKPDESEMMRMVIQSRVGTWDPTLYVDTFTDRLSELVATKAEGGEFQPVVRADRDGVDVSDLLAQLEASIVTKEAA